MSAPREDGFVEIEALVYRLFAEKQFALALLALVMVGQLLTAQFLLLRMTPPRGSQVAAPALSKRVDVVCRGGVPQTLAGAAIAAGELRAKTAVVHLPDEASACLANLDAAEVLVGVGAQAADAAR